MISPATTQRFATQARLWGLLAAMIALAGQIALGAVTLRAPAQPSAIATLDAVSLLCHVGGPAGTASKPLPHQPAGLALSALAQAVAQSAGLLGPATLTLCAPVALASSLLGSLPPVAPPAAARLAAQPRAPPSFA